MSGEAGLQSVESESREVRVHDDQAEEAGGHADRSARPGRAAETRAGIIDAQPGERHLTASVGGSPDTPGTAHPSNLIPDRTDAAEDRA